MLYGTAHYRIVKLDTAFHLISSSRLLLFYFLHFSFSYYPSISFGRFSSPLLPPLLSFLLSLLHFVFPLILSLPVSYPIYFPAFISFSSPLFPPLLSSSYPVVAPTLIPFLLFSSLFFSSPHLFDMI